MFERAKAEGVDVLLIDLLMPKRDGIALVRDSYAWPASNAAHGRQEAANSARRCSSAKAKS